MRCRSIRAISTLRDLHGLNGNPHGAAADVLWDQLAKFDEAYLFRSQRPPTIHGHVWNFERPDDFVNVFVSVPLVLLSATSRRERSDGEKRRWKTYIEDCETSF